MTTTTSYLSLDLVGEILSRVPLTSLSVVRSTCKSWNFLSKNQIVGKAATARKEEFLGFVIIKSKVFSMKFDLQGIRKDDDIVSPSIKKVSVLNQVQASQVFYCDGLLLCVTEDYLVVCNPYLGETWRIQTMNKIHPTDTYFLGYDDNNNKHNHKILRVFSTFVQKIFQIYDFNSYSWKVLDVNCDLAISYCHSVSLKGNTYFVARVKNPVDAPIFLLCFDFTEERLGPRLPLPFNSSSRKSETVTIYGVRDEQLAVLYIGYDKMMKIWITTKIDPNVVSWSKFLEVDMRPLTGCPCSFDVGNFFIEEEKKVAVISCKKTCSSCWYQTARIIGEDGYFKSVIIVKSKKAHVFGNFLFSSYVPSLVQL